MKLGIVAVSIPVVLYLGACLLLYAKQRTLLYHPTPETHTDDARPILLESAGETLKIWQTNPGQERAVLYFGGNGENVALRIPELGESFPHHTVYFVHYRGYGGSTGSPSENGLFQDALNIYDHVRKEHPRISTIGRSLGSGVAIHLASQRRLEKLVLVTPFDSIERLAGEAMPVFPVSLLLRDKYRSVELAPGIETPTLVLIAAQDEVIPRASTDRLVAAFDPARVVTHVLAGATHNTIGGDPEYRARLREYLGDRKWTPPIRRN